jgi:hypothetical protein
MGVVSGLTGPQIVDRTAAYLRSAASRRGARMVKV